MALTTDQLQEGISYWRGTDWPKDFHNADYKHYFAAVPKDGIFSQKWWDRFIRNLHDWRATRPCSFAVLTAHAQKQFAGLSEKWAVTIAPHLDNDIADLEWHEIAAFPLLVEKIKPLKYPSPVFTSKFCHFLAPRIFPVVDNKAMGNPFRTYEEYYKAARAEWLGTEVPIQGELEALLAKEIGAPLFDRFPMKCKLIEICLIGRVAMVYKAA